MKSVSARYAHGKSNVFVTASLIVIFLFLFHSMLLAVTLGVSLSLATRVAWAAYKAYKVGKSIRVAIAPFLGWGGLAWFAVDLIIGWGVSQLISNSPLLNL